MNRQLTYEVVADGGTDRVLVPIIEWAIHRLDPQVELLEPVFRKRKGPVSAFLRDHRSDAMLLFVHRDAESISFEERLAEFGSPPAGVVPVIPVRMTEAWLLISAKAIAEAADRPDADVAVPAIGDVSSLADPKRELEQLLRAAAGNPGGRRGKKFAASLVARRINVATLIEDYAPLERVPAFQAFQLALAAKYPYQEALRG
ncbi:MAG TPA: hypothetical protein VF519_13460 [Mycobacteriales bacterium]